MAGAQLKVVFNPNDKQTAEVLSDLFFGVSYDLQTPKETMIRPVVVGHDFHWYESVTTGRTVVEGDGESSGKGFGTGMALSQAYRVDGMETTPLDLHTNVDSSSTTEMTGRNRFSATGTSESVSKSPMLIPRYEDLPTELYKLDELRHLGAMEIMKLPKRAAWVCSPWLAPIKVHTLETNDLRLPVDVVDDVVTALYEQSPYVHKRDTVRDRRAMLEKRIFAEIEDRQEVDDGLGY